MSDEKRNDRIIIWLTALGLLVGLAAVFIEAVGVFDRGRPVQEQTERVDEGPNEVPGLEFGPHTGIGVAPLSEATSNAEYDSGLEGLPMVHVAPRSGEWRSALCASDVIIEINGVPAADGAEAIEAQLNDATVVLVRPRANLAAAPGPESSLRVNSGDTRRC